MMDITKTEFEVLDALWHQHPASAADIVVQLNIEKPWHEKTVKTLLSRLVKKQAISFWKSFKLSVLVTHIAKKFRFCRSVIDITPMLFYPKSAYVLHM